MATQNTPSLFLTSIERAIESLQTQSAEQQTSQKQVIDGERRYTLGGTAPAKSRKETGTLEDLGEVIPKLYQIKEWLVQDPRLLLFIDNFIGQQVQAKELERQRQDKRTTIITTIVGLVGGTMLGWLVSALASPVIMWHSIFH